MNSAPSSSILSVEKGLEVRDNPITYCLGSTSWRRRWQARPQCAGPAIGSGHTNVGMDPAKRWRQRILQHCQYFLGNGFSVRRTRDGKVGMDIDV